MEIVNSKKCYVQPETVKHNAMNLVQGSHNCYLYYTTLYYSSYYTHYYTTLYYYH